jgi:hypothetical protein
VSTFEQLFRGYEIAACPDWVDEYDLASALRGDAIDRGNCETNHLLPAIQR